MEEITETFFERLLNFGKDWHVTRIETDVIKEEIEIYLEFDLQEYKKGHAESYASIHDYRRNRRWRHLDVMQYKTYINARIPRIKDKEGNVRSVRVPWEDDMERHSYLFENRAIDLLLITKNQTKTAAFLNCNFITINRIIQKSTARGMSLRDDTEIYTELSLDEKAYKRGHEYITVLSDCKTGTIIDVAKSRKKEACKELINNSLTENQRKHVERMSLDMWEPFIAATKETLPQAELVHDRFHLAKYLNEAIDKVRKREVKTNLLLRKSKYKWLKNIDNMTESQYFEFSDLLFINTKVSLAWRLKECFKGLFGCEDWTEAFKKYSDWVDFCLWEKIEEIVKVVHVFNDHIRGVVNALFMNTSNARAERLNGKIQEINTIGRGYRNFQNFRTALLFFNGNLNLYPHNLM